MPRLIVWIPPDKAEQLKSIAQRERRDPRDQAALFIERALERRTPKEREVSMAE
jgi:hypothetical protein